MSLALARESTARRMAFATSFSWRSSRVCVKMSPPVAPLQMARMVGPAPLRKAPWAPALMAAWHMGLRCG